MEMTSSSIVKATRPGRVRIWEQPFPAGYLWFFGFWVTGSAALLHGVGNVSPLTFHLQSLAPLAWMLAWIAWHRPADLLPQPVPARVRPRRALPAALGIGAQNDCGDDGAFDDFTFCPDAGEHGVVWVAQWNKSAGQARRTGTLASGAPLFAGIPTDWESWLVPRFIQVRAIELSRGGSSARFQRGSLD